MGVLFKYILKNVYFAYLRGLKKALKSLNFTPSQAPTHIPPVVFWDNRTWIITPTLRCFLSLRLQRWSFLSGCAKVCMRGRGRCCLSSFPRCTGRVGGPSSRLTPMWSTCIKWGPITTVWDPRCCTSTGQRIQTLHRHCCRYKTFTQTESRQSIRPLESLLTRVGSL